MKNYQISILVIILMFSFASCKKNGIEEGLNPKNINLSLKDKKLVKADNKFGFDLLKKINESAIEGENIMISPISISLALSMTYNGANSTTKQAMEETLNLSDLSVEEINKSYQKIISELISVDDKVNLSIANSIWYRNGFNVLDDFLSVNKQYYDAKVEALDFSNSNSKDIINSWVATNTNDKITEIINTIDPATVMYLINAIYFKGVWHYQFEESETVAQPFFLSNETSIETQTMSLAADLQYANNSLFQAVELPYGQGNYSMMLFLPQSDISTDNIINQLSENNWDDWLNDFSLQNSVNVHLPKFTFEYEKTLNEILSVLGMEIAFGGNADFSKINADGGLYISDVKHKTFIELNEEGTEAAAVTSVDINLTSVGDGESGTHIYFNKPFVFAIREVTTNTIIFIGKMENPSN